MLNNPIMNPLKEVLSAMDACGINTMRRFCNRALRFMDAYRQGLGVKAAAWCVKKQKRHRTRSEETVRAFEDQVKGQVKTLFVDWNIIRETLGRIPRDDARDVS